MTQRSLLRGRGASLAIKAKVAIIGRPPTIYVLNHLIQFALGLKARYVFRYPTEAGCRA